MIRKYIYPDKTLDANGLETYDILEPVPMDTGRSDNEHDKTSDEEEPVDRPPVIVQPTRPTGKGMCLFNSRTKFLHTL